MALKKDVPLDTTGITANYWRIAQIEQNRESKFARVIVNLYLNADVRNFHDKVKYEADVLVADPDDATKTIVQKQTLEKDVYGAPIRVMDFVIGGDKYKDDMTLADLYEALKTFPQLEGAADV